MRNPFDRFFKQLGRLLLSPGGTVETDAEVSPDAQRIDLWYNPDPRRARRVLAPLGLFGRMAMRACVLEPFHRTPSAELVADSILRHRLFCRELSRRKPRPPVPVQWVISSGKSVGALSGLGFRRSRLGKGIYEAPPVWRTRLVVVSELPETRDTLLVRLLGASRTLRRAVAEASLLPKEAPERRLALRLLVKLRLRVLAGPATQTRNEQEFLMSTQDVDKYLSQIERAGMRKGMEKGMQEGMEKGMEKGMQEGLQKGLAVAVLTACRARFGSAPAALTSAVKAAGDQAELQRLLDLVVTSSKQELASALGTKASPRARGKANPRARGKASPRPRARPGARSGARARG